MTLQTFAATDDTHDMAAALQQNGAVVINAVLPEAVSEELCADSRPSLTARAICIKTNLMAIKPCASVV
ncbi:MAG: hypothetical protein CM15mP25_4430 [Gammaproteobacteria bacterium]|nr:MAG: hypothetical protein CM15mP25_4430 [Gammaproteobacteria bacterium]